MIGIPNDPYMKLIKPMYGQTDAPREWWLEATKRLTEQVGLTAHPLDPCFFMAFTHAHELCGLIHLHVDDMLIAGDNREFEKYRKALKAAFNFRTWKTATEKPLTYCGGDVIQKTKKPTMGIRDQFCQLSEIRKTNHDSQRFRHKASTPQ